MTEPARPWPRVLVLSFAALYLPQLVPLVATDLVDQRHCLGLYARFFPVLVGVPFGLSARMASNLGEPLEEVVLWLVAAGTALLLLAASAVALRRWPRGGPLVTGTIALLSAGFSMAAVAFLRA